MTKEQLLEVVEKRAIDIPNPQNKNKKELIIKIVGEYKSRKFWSEYYDHDYYFEI